MLFNSKALKDAKEQNRKTRIRKTIGIIIRKTYSSRKKKIFNKQLLKYFNEQFDTTVYCIVDTVCTVLAGINLVISEAAY